MSGITLYKQVAEPAAPDTDSKVVLFINDTGNPAVKYNDGTSAALLRDGDAYSTSVKPVLTYNATGYEGNDIVVTIANFNDYAPGVTFGLTPQDGSAAIDGDTITWTLPDVDVESDYTLDVTAREIGKATSTSVATVTVQLIPFTMTGLDITDPADGAIDVKENPIVTAGTPVASDPAYNHVSTSWYVMDGATVIAISVDDLVNKNSWQIPAGLSVSTSYTIYRRVKMSNGTLIFNIKSAVNGFTTADTFNAWLDWNGDLDGVSTSVESGFQAEEYVLLGISSTEVLSVTTSNTGATGVLLKRISRATESTNVLTVDNAITVAPATATNIGGLVIDDATVMVCYQNSTGNGRFKIVSKSGGTWSAGSEQNITNTTFTNPRLALMDTGVILCTFEDGTTNNFYIIPLTGGGSSWTAGTESLIVGSVQIQGALIKASAGEALFLYGTTATGDTRGIPLTGIGASWSVGSSFVIDAVTPASYIEADSLSDGTPFCFSRAADGSGSQINFLSKNGVWGVSDTVNVPNAESVARNHITTLTDNALLVSYNTSPSLDVYITAVTKTSGSWSVGHTETDTNAYGADLVRLNDDSALALYQQNFDSLLAKALISG